MYEETRKLLEEIFSIIEGSKLSLLPRDIVGGDENALILQEIVKDDGKNKELRLYLSPGAKIKMHTHKDDWEDYIMENGTKVTCKKGDSHSFGNPYNDRWYILRAIKHRD